MNLPWQNKTGLTKAIAIVATICVLSFGLCTTGVVTGVGEGDSVIAHILTLTQPLFITSLFTLVILLIARTNKSRRTK